MIPITALLLPILLSTVLVFVASSLVWMVLPHHRSDVKGLPDEAALLDTLGRQGVAPAIYNFPHPPSHKAMAEPAFQEKIKKGPVGLIVVRASGPVNMGKMMGQWLAYVLVISILVAYIAGRMMVFGAIASAVFLFTAFVAALAYSVAIVPSAIWWGRPWGVVWKEVLDGVVYGLLTGASFALLWPR